MQTILSGVAPSGNLTIGNYIGALRQWIEEQDKYNCFFCVVDLHAITTPQDSETLRQKTREICALYIAVGIDPEKAHIFIQSQNPDHANLAWILNCFTSIGALGRMTQFKDKSSQQKDFISAGLFNYPVLMAADILLYQADLVPVGEDQKQHLELTRDIAQRINTKFGPIFTIPEPKISQTGARIMSLQNPLAKMSKSDQNPDGSIFLLDNPDQIRKKIMSATTDSEKNIKFETENRPGLANLITIYSFLANLTISEIEKKYTAKGYKEFKQDLAEITVEFLKPVQEKYHKVQSSCDYLDKITQKGLQRAREKSSPTLEKVSKTVGLGG